MPGGDDESGKKRQDNPARPVIISIASWIWILFGCLCLPHFIVCLTIAGGGEVGEVGGGFYVFLVLTILEAAFLYLGVQTRRGRKRDTRVSGTGSILLGIYMLLSLFFVYDGELAGVLFFSTPYFVAGVLALVGRKQYIAWREAQNANQAAKKET